MKNLTKLLMSLLTLVVSFGKRNEVVAFFTGPAAGTAYHEGDIVGEGVASELNDKTKGKQVIVNAGNGKAMILAMNTDGYNIGKANWDPFWFAPDKAWLMAVASTAGIDFANSDLVYGTDNGKRIPANFDVSKIIPFKKDGAKIVYDPTLTGASTVPSNVSGAFTNSSTAPAATGTTTPTPQTANAATTGMKSWASYIWVLIVGAVIGTILLVMAIFRKKRVKVVKK